MFDTMGFFVKTKRLALEEVENPFDEVIRADGVFIGKTCNVKK